MQQEQEVPYSYREPQQPSPEATADLTAYEAARRQREKTEGRCLLGFVVLSIVQQAKETS